MVPIHFLPVGSAFTVPGTRISGRVLGGSYESGFAKVEMVNEDGRLRVLSISPGTEVYQDELAAQIVDQAKARTDADVRARLTALRPQKAPRTCACGCGGMTKGGRFLPGHDARYHAAQNKHGKAHK